MRERLLTVTVAMVAGAVGAALVGSAGVWAHGGDKEAVHACVAKGGALRVTGAPGWGDPAAACDEKAGETPLDWGIRGPQGLRGPAGPAGGTAAEEVVYATHEGAQIGGSLPRSRATAELRLPAGAYRLTGGASVAVGLWESLWLLTGVQTDQMYRVVCNLQEGNRGIDTAVMSGTFGSNNEQSEVEIPGGLRNPGPRFQIHHEVGNRSASAKLMLSGVFASPIRATVRVRCTMSNNPPNEADLRAGVFITLTATPIAKVIEQ